MAAHAEKTTRSGEQMPSGPVSSHIFSRRAVKADAAHIPTDNTRLSTNFTETRFAHDFSRVPAYPRDGQSQLQRVFGEASNGPSSNIPYRDEMEHAFGEDFSKVSAYFGRDKEMGRINANAATYGERVVFSDAAPGKKLVAHELAHVVQQRQSTGVQLKSMLSGVNDAAEREADSVAERAAAGERVSVTTALSAAIHRDIKDKNLKVPLGNFEIDMTKVEVAGDKTGEEGTVKFTPNDKAPNSRSIRLSQAIKTVDVETGKDFDWSDLNKSSGAQKNRNKMQTTDAEKTHVTVKGETLKSIAAKYFGDPSRYGEIFNVNKAALAPAMKSADGDKSLPEKLSLKISRAIVGGYVIDHLPTDPKAKVRTAKTDPVVPQDYVWPGETIKDQNQHGSKAGTTIVPAILSDKPKATGITHLQYFFQTVARSADDGTQFGTVFWSFEADGINGKVTKESSRVAPGVSGTFRSALDEFNKFYKNPPYGP
jgi:nucleoid-associated protein YgaU